MPPASIRRCRWPLTPRAFTPDAPKISASYFFQAGRIFGDDMPRRRIGATPVGCQMLDAFTYFITGQPSAQLGCHGQLFGARPCRYRRHTPLFLPGAPSSEMPRKLSTFSVRHAGRLYRYGRFLEELAAVAEHGDKNDAVSTENATAFFSPPRRPPPTPDMR